MPKTWFLARMLNITRGVENARSMPLHSPSRTRDLASEVAF